jgi:hypothetical protein
MTEWSLSQRDGTKCLDWSLDILESKTHPFDALSLAQGRRAVACSCQEGAR